MSAYLPKTLYRVTRVGGGRTGYLDPGGKTFAALDHAKEYRRRLRAQGAQSDIYVCEPDWKLLDEPEQT